MLDSQMRKVKSLFGKQTGVEATVTDKRCLQGSICSKTMLNLSQRVLSAVGIHVLQYGLDFLSTQESINEPKLRKDFKDFSKRISDMSLLKTFLINQHLAFNLTGNFLLIILVWSYF